MLTVPCVLDLCAIDQQLCQDENSLLSFEAICSIHKLMDDDADGTVDTTETDGVRQAGPLCQRCTASSQRAMCREADCKQHWQCFDVT